MIRWQGGRRGKLTRRLPRVSALSLKAAALHGMAVTRTRVVIFAVCVLFASLFYYYERYSAWRAARLIPATPLPPRAPR